MKTRYGGESEACWFVDIMRFALEFEIEWRKEEGYGCFERYGGQLLDWGK